MALFKVTNDLLMASKKKLVSILILVDFSKAFYSVDHSPLCSKLTNATSLIRSYLSDCTQCVWFNNQASIFVPLASSGVIQRSVLGPLHLSLFINDITAVIQVYSCRLNTDDVQIYTICLPSEYVDCVERMNADLERMLVNLLSLRFDDIKHLHYTWAESASNSIGN
jgi:hypothetical protein